MSAEYVASEGNSNIILCERGIRTFSDFTRFTLDVASIPVIKAHSHLPVIVDPSHPAGKRELVEPLSLSAIAAGADLLAVFQLVETAVRADDDFISLRDAVSQLYMTAVCDSGIHKSNVGGVSVLYVHDLDVLRLTGPLGEIPLGHGLQPPGDPTHQVLLVRRTRRLAEQLHEPGPQFADGHLPHSGNLTLDRSRHAFLLHFELQG